MHIRKKDYNMNAKLTLTVMTLYFNRPPDLMIFSQAAVCDIGSKGSFKKTVKLIILKQIIYKVKFSALVYSSLDGKAMRLMNCTFNDMASESWQFHNDSIGQRLQIRSLYKIATRCTLKRLYHYVLVIESLDAPYMYARLIWNFDINSWLSLYSWNHSQTVLDFKMTFLL